MQEQNLHKKCDIHVCSTSMHATQFGQDGIVLVDGKICIFPFTQQVPATKTYSLRPSFIVTFCHKSSSHIYSHI